MRYRIIFGFLATLAILMNSTMANALLISGDFNGTFPPGSTVSSLSGTWEAEFDDNLLTGTGFEFFDNNLILTSLTMDPNPLGLTLFDTSNVGLALFFQDGVLDGVQLGGMLGGGGPAGIDPTVDDFYVEYLGNFDISDVTAMILTIGTESNVFHESTEFSGSFSFEQTVPEPTSMALLSIGLAGLVLTRRRKVY